MNVNDCVGTCIEEGDIVAYAATSPTGSGACLYVGTVTGFTEKSIRVDVYVHGDLCKRTISKDRAAVNAVVVSKKCELEMLDVK